MIERLDPRVELVERQAVVVEHGLSRRIPEALLRDPRTMRVGPVLPTRRIGRAPAQQELREPVATARAILRRILAGAALAVAAASTMTSIRNDRRDRFAIRSQAAQNTQVPL